MLECGPHDSVSAASEEPPRVALEATARKELDLSSQDLERAAGGGFAERCLREQKLALVVMLAGSSRPTVWLRAAATCCFALAALAGSWEEQELPESENLVMLSADEFDAQIGKLRPVLVNFYAPW